MPVITQRPRAREDLAEIWDYIADDSAARADAFIDTVNGKFRTLAGQPGMGRLRDELKPSLRSFPVGRYVIYYFPLPDGVDIVLPDVFCPNFYSAFRNYIPQSPPVDFANSTGKQRLIAIGV